MPSRAKPVQRPPDGGLTMRQAVAARLQRRLAGMEVSWKFGHASLETDAGKVFCFVTGDGSLAMKLPAARIQALIEAGPAAPLRMGQRTMREWIVLPEPESSQTLKLLHEAKAYVESLPQEKRRRDPVKKSA